MRYKPDTVAYTELLPGVFMKVLSYGETTMICEFHLKQGAVIPAHHHPHEQSGYLISGALRFSGDEPESLAGPGHSWSFKGGVSHGVEVLADSVAIEVFSPIREDYLPYSST